MTNEKNIARQVAPEYQKAPEINAENVYIFGNRHFRGVNDEGLRTFCETLEEIAAATEDEMLPRALCWYYLPRESGEGYTDAAAAALIDAAREYCASRAGSDDERHAICAALEAVRGEPYGCCTLRGCCQSEWQYIIMPEADAETRKYYEIEYFNLGTEWIVNGDFSVYVYDNPRREIADAAGCRPEDLRLLAFDGYEMTAKYRETEA